MSLPAKGATPAQSVSGWMSADLHALVAIMDRIAATRVNIRQLQVLRCLHGSERYHVKLLLDGFENLSEADGVALLRDITAQLG